MRLQWFALALVGCVGNVEHPTPSDAGDSGSELVDSGVADSGVADSGVVVVDAGELDAGRLDAGMTDAGVVDAGLADAGPFSDGGFIYVRGNGCGAIDAGLVVDDGGTPAWLIGAPLGGFVEIAGSQGVGVVVDAWGGFTLKEDSSELFFLATGGHGDSNDNRVVSISLLADAPKWVLRCTPSTRPIVNAGYYDDGVPGLNAKPGSTHTYDYTAWVPQAANGRGRLLRMGMFGTWPMGFGAPNVDGFDPVANEWDPPGTWPDTPGTYGSTRNRDTGDVYVAAGSRKITPDGGLVVTPGIRTIRFPNAWDSRRHAIFGLMYGDGQGYDLQLGVVARLNDPIAATSTNITFRPSAALTQFINDRPTYAGMDYDPENDRYLFYAAADCSTFPVIPQPNRVYVIVPNNTSTWDMELLTLAATSVTPAQPPTSGAGINGRFKYVPRLKGFVLLPNQRSSLYFLKTSN